MQNEYLLPIASKPLIYLRFLKSYNYTRTIEKSLETQLFHPIGTQCVIGVQLVRAKARRKLMHLSLRLAFYIRIELDRSNVDGRSFQALTDKMLCFQGLYGFYRKHPVSLNFLKTIENTGQTGFLRISDDSSQIVVTVISLPEII